MSSTVALVLGLVLLLGNAFFVGAEFAIISARRSAIEPKAEAGSRSAKTVLWAMEHVSLMLACAQLGVTVCSTSLGAIAEPAIAHLVEGPLHAMHLPLELGHVIGFVVALGIVVYLHVVIGEMVPKNLAVSGPDRAVMYFGPPLVWLSHCVKPIIVALNWLANHILRLLRIEPKDEVTSTFTAEEVASIVDVSTAEGVLADEQGLLAGALEFSDKCAVDVMIARDELVTMPSSCTPADIEHAVARTGYSRFPIVDETTADDGEAEPELIGYLHVKDVLSANAAERLAPVPRWRIRSLAQVGPTTEVEDVLAVMQDSGAHLARVTGGQAGIGVVFLEDILEELVGEVRDSMQRMGELRTRPDVQR